DWSASATVKSSANPQQAQRWLRCEFRDLAAATGTLAPPGGVDCNGDGDVDLAAGAPTACRLQSNASSDVVELEGPLHRLLEVYAYRQPVDLVGDGVTVVPGGDYGSLDLKVDQHLSFHASFSCAGRPNGKTTIPMSARIGGLDVAHSQVLLTCGTLIASAATEAPPPANTTEGGDARPAAPPPTVPVLPPPAPAQPAVVPGPVVQAQLAHAQALQPGSAIAVAPEYEPTL